MNKLLLTGIIFGFMVTAGMAAQAEPPQTVDQTAAVVVGNKFCPVSGEKVGQMGPPVKYTYNGKVYYLCCPMCKGDFSKNPQKYAAIAEGKAKQ